MMSGIGIGEPPGAEPGAGDHPFAIEEQDLAWLASAMAAASTLQARYRGLRARTRTHPRAEVLQVSARLHAALGARRSGADFRLAANALELTQVASHSAEAVVRSVGAADDLPAALRSAALLASRLHGALELIAQISLQRTPADVMRHVQLAALHVCGASAAEVLLLAAGAQGRALALTIAPSLFLPASHLAHAGKCALTGAVQVAEDGVDEGVASLMLCELLEPEEAAAGTTAEAAGQRRAAARRSTLARGGEFFVHHSHTREAEERAAANGCALCWSGTRL
ncbi:hypothetical protein T492DRAFT_866736 [Pavlovales sp. CCMP2436]|nr:hypothetical protein T492DRAFT_866736 [Pavlovales sp. CCMP2436]